MISYLLLFVPPANGQEASRFCAGEPAIAWQPFGRQQDFDDATMQTFSRMMVDCRAQVFEIAAGAAVVAAVPLVGAAGFPGNFRQHFAAPPTIESVNATVKLFFVALAFPDIGKIDRYDVRDFDLLDVLDFAFRGVF